MASLKTAEWELSVSVADMLRLIGVPRGIKNAEACLFCLHCARRVEHMIESEVLLRALDSFESWIYDMITDEVMKIAWREVWEVLHASNAENLPSHEKFAIRTVARACNTSRLPLIWRAVELTAKSAIETSQHFMDKEEFEIELCDWLRKNVKPRWGRG